MTSLGEARGCVSIVIIGFGNTLRGDDALGPIAAERLEALVGDDGVEVFVRQTLTPELAGSLANASYALFIDASKVGEAGVVQERELAPDPNSDVSLVHFLDPVALLTWTQQIYGRVPEATLLTVLAENLDFGERLSPGLEAVLPEVVARGAALVKARRGGGAIPH